MSWCPSDGPSRRTLRTYAFANCSPGCCRNGLRLCEEPRDPDDDLHEEDDE